MNVTSKSDSSTRASLIPKRLVAIDPKLQHFQLVHQKKQQLLKELHEELEPFWHGDDHTGNLVTEDVVRGAMTAVASLQPPNAPNGPSRDVVFTTSHPTMPIYFAPTLEDPTAAANPISVPRQKRRLAPGIPLSMSMDGTRPPQPQATVEDTRPLGLRKTLFQSIASHASAVHIDQPGMMLSVFSQGVDHATPSPSSPNLEISQHQGGNVKSSKVERRGLGIDDALDVNLPRASYLMRLRNRERALHAAECQEAERQRHEREAELAEVYRIAKADAIKHTPDTAGLGSQEPRATPPKRQVSRLPSSIDLADAAPHTSTHNRSHAEDPTFFTNDPRRVMDSRHHPDRSTNRIRSSKPPRMPRTTSSSHTTRAIDSHSLRTPSTRAHYDRIHDSLSQAAHASLRSNTRRSLGPNAAASGWPSLPLAHETSCDVNALVTTSREILVSSQKAIEESYHRCSSRVL